MRKGAVSAEAGAQANVSAPLARNQIGAIIKSVAFRPLAPPQLVHVLAFELMEF
jgi:hypothetical protein